MSAAAGTAAQDKVKEPVATEEDGRGVSAGSTDLPKLRSASAGAEQDEKPGHTSDEAGVESPNHSAARMRELTGMLNLAVARLGPGPYQLVVLLLGGGVYAAEGALLLMLSLLARGLAEEWEVSPLLAGAFVTLIFAGLIAGTITGGIVCDSHGRRLPILATYLGITVFLLCAILAPGFAAFLTAKLLLGFFLGFGVPAANAIVAESCPPGHRSNIYCMTMILFSCGQLYAAGLVWAFSPALNHEEMNWRVLLALAALLPCGLFILAYFFLLESPHWLLVTWQVSEARAVLQAMVRYKRMDEPEEVNSWAAEEIADQMRSPAKPSRSWWSHSGGNGSPASGTPNEGTPLLDGSSKALGPWILDCVDEVVAKTKAGIDFSMVRLQALFSPSFRSTTLLMVYVTFATNFAYYGMIYGLPDTLKRSSVEGDDKWSPAAGVFFSAMFEIPGVFLAIVLGVTIGRRKNMSFAFAGCAISLCFTIHALHIDEINGTGGLASIFCAKLLLATGYIVVYLYLLECYPTTFRATGLAFCMVLGRGGAFLCPFLYDGLMHHWDVGPVWYFLAIACAMFMASVACCLLPYETKDAELEGEAPPGTLQQLRC